MVAPSFNLEVIWSNGGLKVICLALKVLPLVCKRQRRVGIDTNSFVWLFVYIVKNLEFCLSVSSHWSFHINISRIDEYIFVRFAIWSSVNIC